MGQKEELDQQLWEFVYDLLSEQEVEDVRARITSEPDVARAYSRVKLESELGALAARHDEDPIALQPPADAREEAPRVALRRPLRSPLSPAARSANWLVGLAATALVCLMGYGYFHDASHRATHPPPPASFYVCTRLSAPDRIREQVTNPFFVRTTDLSGAPRAARLVYRFRDSDGEVKLAGNAATDAKGRLQIDLPGSLVSEVARLEVETVDSRFSPKIRADLTQSDLPLATYLAMGKPRYQPGETAQFRSVTLSAVGLKAEEQVVVAYDVWDAHGRPVVPHLPQKRTDRGVGAGSFVVPPELPSGTYSMVAYSPQAKFSAVSRRFDVQRDESDPLAIEEPADVAVQPQLPAATEDPHVTMRIPEPVLAADAPVEVELLASRKQSKPLAVAAYCRDAMVGQQVIDAAGFTRSDSNWFGQVTVPMAREASGVLRVVLFDYEHDPPKPIAERLVFRQPRHHLTLQLENLAESYVPGSQVKLRLQATNEADEPTPAVLGVGIADTASLPVGPAFHTRLPTHFYLAAELNHPEEIEQIAFSLDKELESGRELDLLLSTDGQRNSRQARLNALVQAGEAGRGGMGDGGGFTAKGTAPDDVLALGATSTAGEFSASRWAYSDFDSGTLAPLLYDNSDEVRRAVSMPVRTAPAAGGVDVAGIGRVLVFGGAALLVVALLVNVMRLSSGVRVWAPVVAIACASLLVGVIWMQESHPKLGAVATTVLETGLDLKDQAPFEGAGATQTQRSDKTVLEPAEQPLMGQAAETAVVQESELPEAKEAVGRAVSQSDAKTLEMRAAGTTSLVPPQKVNGSGGMSVPGSAARLSMQDAPAAPAPTASRFERSTRARSMGPAAEFHYESLADRDRSPATMVYWNPLLVTDENGRATIEFKVPDRKTQLLLYVDAHAAGRLGALEMTIVSRAPAD